MHISHAWRTLPNQTTRARSRLRSLSLSIAFRIPRFSFHLRFILSLHRIATGVFMRNRPFLMLFIELFLSHIQCALLNRSKSKCTDKNKNSIEWDLLSFNTKYRWMFFHTQTLICAPLMLDKRATAAEKAVRIIASIERRRMLFTWCKIISNETGNMRSDRLQMKSYPVFRIQKKENFWFGKSTLTLFTQFNAFSLIFVLLSNVYGVVLILFFKGN